MRAIVQSSDNSSIDNLQLQKAGCNHVLDFQWSFFNVPIDYFADSIGSKIASFEI